MVCVCEVCMRCVCTCQFDGMYGAHVSMYLCIRVNVSVRVCMCGACVYVYMHMRCVPCAFVRMKCACESCGVCLMVGVLCVLCV